MCVCVLCWETFLPFVQYWLISTQDNHHNLEFNSPAARRASPISDDLCSYRSLIEWYRQKGTPTQPVRDVDSLSAAGEVTCHIPRWPQLSS